MDKNNYLPYEILLFLKIGKKIKEYDIRHIHGISILSIIHNIVFNKDYLDRVEMEDRVFYLCVLLALMETDNEPGLSELILELYCKYNI